MPFLLKQNIGHKQLLQFPNLNKLQNQAEYRISDDNLSAYCNHLLSLCKDWKTRFEGIIFIEIPNWLINSFMTDVSDITELKLQEELLILKNNFEIKPSFKKSYHDFWLQESIPERYPNLWKAVKIFFKAFPSTYMAERGFNSMTQLLSKQRNDLKIEKRGDLRMYLSNLEPNVNALAKSHQAQGSHAKC